MFLLPVNIWAVIVSSLLTMAVGYVWYSPILFGKQWMKLSGADTKALKRANGNMPSLYAKSFAAAVIMIYVLAQLTDLTLVSGVTEGAILGGMVWLGFVAASMVNTVLYEGKSWKLYAITSGYYLVCLVASGIILAVWI